MPGILKRLGSWGTSIIKAAIKTGRTIAETVGILKPVKPAFTVTDAPRDWGRVSRSEDASPQIAALKDASMVPEALFSTTDIPWARKYAYTVSIFGRDLATGRFARQDYDMTTSRQLSIGEVKEMAGSRIGKAGISALIDIFDIEVSNAWTREE